MRRCAKTALRACFDHREDKPMDKLTGTLDIIKSSKLIAISRGLYGDRLVKATLALYKGGVRAFEAAFVKTLPVEKTVECIKELVRCLPQDAVVGAGTVLETEQLDAAFEAGASFFVAPNTDGRVIAQAKRLGMVSIPGALTPTEIAGAYEFGADIVKVFPAGTMGVQYFKQIKAPLAHIPMAAVGGLDHANIRAFYDAGAVAFGISGSLYNKTHIENGEYSLITEAAKRYADILK